VLAPSANPEPIAVELIKGVAKAMQRHPDRSVITTWLNIAVSVNMSELKGLYKLLLRWRPRCVSQLPACVSALKFMARLKTAEKDKAVHELMHDWIDDVLLAMLEGARRQRLSDADFVQKNRQLLALRIDRTTLNKVLDNNMQKAAVEKEPSRVVLFRCLLGWPAYH
jgi:hypothetical protein